MRRARLLLSVLLIVASTTFAQAQEPRRPLVALHHPDGEDLDHIFVGWPLVGLPTVGVNEAS